MVSWLLLSKLIMLMHHLKYINMHFIPSHPNFSEIPWFVYKMWKMSQKVCPDKSVYEMPKSFFKVYCNDYLSSKKGNNEDKDKNQNWHKLTSEISIIIVKMSQKLCPELPWKWAFF